MSEEIPKPKETEELLKNIFNEMRMLTDKLTIVEDKITIEISAQQIHGSDNPAAIERRKTLSRERGEIMLQIAKLRERKDALINIKNKTIQ